MEYKIKITGSGIKRDIIDALRNLANALQEEEGLESVENGVISAEIEEVESEEE